MSTSVPATMRRLFLVECYSNGCSHAEALAESERMRSRMFAPFNPALSCP